MTVHQGAATPLALPISSLLPPKDDSTPFGPYEPLPYPLAALLGPLPLTSPLHLALSYLTLSDLPEYVAPTRSPKLVIPSAPARVVIINCSSTWSADLEEDDEDWLRDNAAQYGIMEQLSRVDIRFCPSPKHLLLLLTLLTTSSSSINDTDGPHEIPTTPGLIILYDMATLFMRPTTDENRPPGLDENDEPQAGNEMPFEFVPGMTISDYLTLIAAARGAMQHLASASDSIRPQLLLLEPHLSSSSHLPILKPAASHAQKGTLATPVREKKVNLREALEHVLCRESVGVINAEPPDPDAEPDAPILYSLTFGDDGRSHRLKKRHCDRSPWARAVPVAGEGEEGLRDPGGWRWEWE